MSCTPQALPAVVLANFQKQFPSAVVIRWKMDARQTTAQYFVASFKIGITNWQVTYDKDGRCTMKMKDMLFEDLPQNIKDKLIKEFAGYSVRKPQYFEYLGADPYYSLTLFKAGQVMNLRLKASDASVIAERKQ